MGENSDERVLTISFCKMAEEGDIKCYHLQSESLRDPAVSEERTGSISGSQTLPTEAEF